MDEQTEIIELRPKNMFVPICITQTVCIAVILIAVLVIKFFFKTSFVKFENWYKNNILDQTTISDVFNEDMDSEI